MNLKKQQQEKEEQQENTILDEPQRKQLSVRNARSRTEIGKHNYCQEKSFKRI